MANIAIETIQYLNTQLADANERAEKAERERDEARGKHLPPAMMSEYARLDAMWQDLVRDRDRLVAENARLREALEACLSPAFDTNTPNYQTSLIRTQARAALAHPRADESKPQNPKPKTESPRE